MEKVVRFLQGLPEVGSKDPLPAPWSDMCTSVFCQAHPEIGSLVRRARMSVRLPLLRRFRLNVRTFETPHICMLAVSICPHKEYFRKTTGMTDDEIARCVLSAAFLRGVSLEFAFYRPALAPQIAPGAVMFYGVALGLKVEGRKEWAAFRKIHYDYRGILCKLFETAPLSLSLPVCLDEVENVRSRKLLPKLDALFGGKGAANYAADGEASFSIEYAWNPLSPPEEGLRAFVVLAILFECVQKAATMPRSKGDHILRYWNSLSFGG